MADQQAPTPRAVLGDPAALLFRLDLAQRMAHFIGVEARTFQDSAWLDYRIAHHTGHRWQLPLDDLSAHPSRPVPPTAFLFHTAFCCSTLLARALQALPHTFVLREPLVLRDLADARRGVGPGAAQVPGLIAPVLDQLAKHCGPRSTLVLKPTNLADNLVPDLLAWQPEARGLVLSSSFESWMVSCLKKPPETQARFPALARDFGADDPALVAAGGAAEPADRIEAMVLTWMLQRRAWTRRLTQDAGRRLRSLGAERLLADPVTALSAVAEFLGIAAAPAELAAVVGGPVWRRNAKDPGLAYGAGQRAAEARFVTHLHRAELHAAAVHRARWEQRLPTETALPAALLAAGA